METNRCPVTGLELRRLPLAVLKPAPYNPRKTLRPTEPAYRKLAASLREFGLVEPLVWNETTGHVVGGHMRLAILKEMRVADVPVSVVRLSPEREKALNVVLNNREAQGRFDIAKLVELLGELEEVQELEATGFDPDDLTALRLEPIENLPAHEESADRVEVTLAMDRETYNQVAARLDALVGEHDLVSHVRYLGEPAA